MVGILGNIRFRVSSRRVLTFQNMKREISTTWNTLDRISQKPLVEYGGADLQKLSLEITLDASLGVKPKSMLRTLEEMTESSQAHDLVLGRMRIGKHPWVVTKCSQAYDIILRGGEIYKATVTLSLMEYV